MKLAVISGKGGTGKSTVTATFISIAKHVLAIDCDVEASNLYLIFDPNITREEKYISGQSAYIDPDKCIRCALCQQNCSFEAISLVNNNLVVSEIACEGCKLCMRLCPNEAITMLDADKSRIYHATFRYGNMVYGKLAPGEENSGKLISKIREQASNLAKEKGYELEIMDGPPGIACPVLSTITGVHKIVIVTEPSLSGNSDLKRTMELAKEFCEEIYVIINKYDLDIDNSNNIVKWCETQGVPVVAKLPFDVQMVEAVFQKQSIVEYNKNSECAIELTKAFYSIIK